MPRKQCQALSTVLIQADLEAAGARPMETRTPVKGKDGSFPKGVAKNFLAKDQVTFVGEAVAMVVAETLAEARDAAELIQIDYEPLDAAGTLEAAPTGARIWEEIPGNLCLDWQDGKEDACNEAFANAAYVVDLDMVQNRVVVNSMETRDAIGDYDSRSESFTLHSGNQGSGGLRANIAGILGVPPEKVRVISPDVGGGFGMKAGLYPEQCCVLIAAKITGRPVRWSSDRTEAFLTDHHGRDMRTRAEGSRSTRMDGFSGCASPARRIWAAISRGFAPFIPTLAGSRIFGGVYRVPAFFTNIKRYFSNTAPINAYRGAGRPEAAYLHGAADGRRSAPDRHRPRRDPQAQSDRAEMNCLTRTGGACPSIPGTIRACSRKGLKRADVAGFAGAPQAVGSARKAARPWHRLLCRDHRRGGQRTGARRIHRQWRRRALCRHAVERAGARDRVRAARRREARRAVRIDHRASRATATG